MRGAALIVSLAILAGSSAAGAADAEPAAPDPTFVPGMPNRASAHVEYENFDGGRSPWGLLSLEYTRKIRGATLIGRLNQAHRFGQDDTQLEFDAYPKLWRKAYGYFNVGRSDSGATGELFPEWRYGAEIFQGLPAHFEVSAGLRYLDYASTRVTIYTGSVAYYWKDWWFSFRPYHSRSRSDGPNGTIEDDSTSGNFQARWYFGKPIEYLQLSAGKGSGVETGEVTNPARLDDWAVQADVRKLVASRTMIRAGLGYRAGEQLDGTTVHSIVVRIGVDVFF